MPLKTALNIKKNVISLTRIGALLLKHRSLTWAMARRDITDRYTGQVIGTLWGIGHPLLLIAVYVLVFSYIFKIKLESNNPRDYTTFIISGLLPWMLIQDVMNKGASVITQNSSLVKQIVFPIEILPIKTVLSALLSFCIGSVVLVSYGAIKWTLSSTLLLLPIALILLIAMLTGLCMFLAVAGAYLRDVKDIVSVISMLGYYVHPIVFSEERAPTWLRLLLPISPFSHVVWCFQDIYYYGAIEHPWSWPIYAAWSIGSLVLGFRFFEHFKPSLGNLL